VSLRTSVLAANENKSNHTEYIYLGFARNDDQTGGGLTILSFDAGSDPVLSTTNVQTVKCDSMPVTGIAIINDTLVYISSPTSIYQLTNNNMSSLKKISKITTTGSFNTIAVNGDLYTYDAVQDTLYNISNLGVFTANVNAITCNNKTGQYWISTANGIYLFTKEDAPHTVTAATITAYPNPVSRHSLQNGHVLHFAGVQPNTSSNTTASFSGSSSTQASSTIRIYDMAGSLVAIIADMNTTIFSWNGSNRAGKIVLPGMYFFIATAENGTTCKGKIMVVP
jgi:hypothetical protein